MEKPQIKVRKVVLKVIKEKNLTEKVKSIKLEKPKEFNFIPGQYLSIEFQIDGEYIKRPYSIASSPKEKLIELCIKKIETGKASKKLFEIKKGDKLNAIGPLGNFYIKRNDRDIMFISVGTGISPFVSMIKGLLEKKFNKKIFLIKGFRNENETLYDEEFKELKKNYKNFDFINVLSRPLKKDANKGYVQDHLDKYIKNYKGDVYLCGLTEAIEALKEKLHSSKITDDRIFFEKYG